MTTSPRRRWLRILVHIRRALRMLALIALAAMAWGVTVYVCGRKVWMIQDPQHLIRLLLPAIH